MSFDAVATRPATIEVHGEPRVLVVPDPNQFDGDVRVSTAGAIPTWSNAAGERRLPAGRPRLRHRRPRRHSRRESREPAASSPTTCWTSWSRCCPPPTPAHRCPWRAPPHGHLRFRCRRWDRRCPPRTERRRVAGFGRFEWPFATKPGRQGTAVPPARLFLGVRSSTFVITDSPLAVSALRCHISASLAIGLIGPMSATARWARSVRPALPAPVRFSAHVLVAQSPACGPDHRGHTRVGQRFGEPGRGRGDRGLGGRPQRDVEGAGAVHRDP